MMLTLTSFSPRTGMLDSLCGYWDVHELTGGGCFETCNDILKQALLLQANLTQLQLASRSYVGSELQPFGSPPQLSPDVCCTEPFKNLT